MVNPFAPSYNGTFGAQPTDTENDGGFWSDVGDVALGIPRGVVGAAKGAYGLVDKVLTGDALPDWNTNPLGESKTIVGGLVQGAAQFLTGFLPISGGLGALGMASGVARGLLAGAAADAVVWEGHQQRLSNLVQSVPALANPVTEFLAASEDDSEVTGRLKNVLEGAGLGAMTEAALLGFKKLRVYQKTFAAKQAEMKALMDTVEDVTPRPEEMQAELEKAHAEAAKAAEAAVPEAEIKKAYDAAIPDDLFPRPAQTLPLKSTIYPVTGEGISRAIAENPEGFTMNARTGQLLDSSVDKWAVADPAYLNERFYHPTVDSSKVPPPFKPKEGDYIGAWKDDKGSIHVDHVRLFDTKEEATAFVKKVSTSDVVGRTAYNLKTGELHDLETGLTWKANEGATPRGHWAIPAQATELSGSAVVDKSGNLLPMMHGTTAQFGTDEFRPLSHFGTAHASERFVTTAKEVASLDKETVDNIEKSGGKLAAPQTHEVYLNIKNPLELSDSQANNASLALDALVDKHPEAYAQVVDIKQMIAAPGGGYHFGPINGEYRKGIPETIALLKKFGYDGIVYGNAMEDSGSKSWMIFDPNQVVPASKVHGDYVGAMKETAGMSSAADTAFLESQAKAAGGEAKAAGETAQAPAGEPAAGSPAPSPEDRFGAKSPVSRVLSAFSERLQKYAGYSADDIKKAIEGIDKIVAQHAEAGIPLATNPANLTGAELLQLHLHPQELNLANFRGPDDVLAYARATFDLFEAANKAWMGDKLSVQTLKEQNLRGLAEAANVLNGSAEEVAANLGKHLDSLEEGTKALSARVIATRYLVSTLGEAAIKQIDHIEEIARGAAAGQLETEILKALEHAKIYNDTVRVLRGSLSEIGRALGGQRVITESGQLSVNSVLDLMDNLPAVKRAVADAGGTKDILEKLRKVKQVYADGNVAGLTRAMEAVTKGPWRRTYDAFMEFWMNALLSGPKTAVVNAIGPAMFSVYKPLEGLLGAYAIKAAGKISGNTASVLAQDKVISELTGQIAGLVSSAHEAFATAKALGWDHPDVFDRRTGSSVFDPAMREKAITPKNLGIDPASTLGQAVAGFGNVVRIPTNVLGSTDNFLKMANFRAAAVARLTTEYAAQGLGHEEIAGKVAETMDRMIWEHQIYSRDQLMRRGLATAADQGIVGEAAQLEFAGKYADSMMKAHPEDAALAQFAKEQGWGNTLTTPAAEGSWSWSIQNFVSQHPVMRLVLPFVNTPMNIMAATGQRLDMIGPVRALFGMAIDSKWTSLEGSKNAFIRDLTSGDARKQSEAVGRLAAGSAIATSIYVLAGNGTITGHGPVSVAQKQTMQQAGWQEYSIKTPNGYVSYARLDPIASLLGTVADLVEYSRWAPPEDQGTLHNTSMGIVVALANNMTNKTYVSGLANFLDAARQPDKNVQSFFNRYAASLVPNILGQAVPGVAGDPIMRDVRGMVDAMAAKIPGVSKLLPPQRNVLGEPIERPLSLGGPTTDWWLPLGYREVSDDNIKLELASVGHGFTPPKRVVNGIDLSEIKVGDTTAFDRWGELQGSVRVGGMNLRDALRKTIASREYQQAIPTVVGETMSPRVNMLNSVIFKYRDAAYAQLLRESPQVRAADASRASAKRAARRGDILSILANKVPGS